MNQKKDSFLRVVLLLVFAFLLSVSPKTDLHAQSPSPTPAKAADRTVQSLVDEAARKTLEKFADKKLEETQLSITLINLRDPQHPVKASFRGNERIYPASVVKLELMLCAVANE